jgi:hypothetical protein
MKCNKKKRGGGWDARSTCGVNIDMLIIFNGENYPRILERSQLGDKRTQEMITHREESDSLQGGKRLGWDQGTERLLTHWCVISLFMFYVTIGWLLKVTE